MKKERAENKYRQHFKTFEYEKKELGKHSRRSFFVTKMGKIGSCLSAEEKGL